MRRRRFRTNSVRSWSGTACRSMSGMCGTDRVFRGNRTVVPPFQDGIPIDVNPQAGGRPKAPFGLGYPIPARWASRELKVDDSSLLAPLGCSSSGSWTSTFHFPLSSTNKKALADGSTSA